MTCEYLDIDYAAILAALRDKRSPDFNTLLLTAHLGEDHQDDRTRAILAFVNLASESRPVLDLDGHGVDAHEEDMED